MDIASSSILFDPQLLDTGRDDAGTHHVNQHDSASCHYRSGQDYATGTARPPGHIHPADLTSRVLGPNTNKSSSIKGTRRANCVNIDSNSHEIRDLKLNMTYVAPTAHDTSTKGIT